MDKFNIEFKEVVSEQADSESLSVPHQSKESQPALAMSKGSLKTLYLSIIAGILAFSTISLVCFIFQQTLGDALGNFYDSTLDTLPYLSINLESIYRKFDWKHILLVVHQQFGVIHMNVPEAISYSGDSEPARLFATYHMGLGVLLFVPFIFLSLTYKLFKRWVYLSKVKDGIFIVGTSFTYSLMVAITGFNSSLTAKSHLNEATSYVYDYSIFSIFSFTMIVSLVSLYISTQFYKGRTLGFEKNINSMQEAFKLLIKIFLICYVILFVLTLLGIHRGELVEGSWGFALLFSPFLLAIVLFSQFHFMWMSSDEQGFLSYSILNGFQIEKDQSSDDIMGVISYIEGDISSKVLLSCFALILIVFFIHKGYIITKYSKGNPKRELLKFSTYFALFTSLFIYLSSFDLFLIAQGYEGTVSKAQLQLRVDEIQLFMNAFIITTGCALMGAMLYMWKVRNYNKASHKNKKL